MNLSFLCLVTISVVATIKPNAHGFGLIETSRRTSHHRDICYHRLRKGTRTTKRSPFFGIMDDMMNETDNGGADKTMSTASSSTTTTHDADAAYEQLFQALVFSTGDTRTEVTNQLKACTKPKFIEYLASLLAASEDTEESHALQELLDLIADVQSQEQQQQLEAAAAAEKIQQEALALQNEEETDSSNLLSSTEVLKRASDIDRAVVAAAASDDEKESDFISDCKEVVNLSGAFNNRGQMRVGG